MNRRFQRKNENPLGQNRGSVMIVVVGLVIIISFTLAAAIHWNANVLISQMKVHDADLRGMERYNADRIIDNVVRRQLAMNDTNIFSTNFVGIMNSNLSRSERQGMENVGFKLAETTTPESPLLPPDRPWMQGNDFRMGTDPNPYNPLFYLRHYPHPDVNSANTNVSYFQVLYQLYYWKSTNAGGLTNLAMKLPLPPDNSVPQNDETRFYKKKLHIREIPSCQLQLIAVDRVNTEKTTSLIKIEHYLNSSDPNDDVNGDGTIDNNDLLPGLAFFPYGLSATNHTTGGSINVNDNSYVVTSEKWNPTASISVGAFKAITRPGLGVSWLLDPYAIAESGNEGNFQHQKYYTKSTQYTYNGLELKDSGGNIVNDPYGAIHIDKKYGTQRVVVDLNNSLFSAGAYYIDCTTPSAKQRGVVVIGSGASVKSSSAILTNGALWLEGSQTGTPLIAGTSYGGIVFANTGDNPEWCAYLVNPSRQLTSIYSVGIANAGWRDLSLNAKDELTGWGLSYDTVQIKGDVPSAGTRVGFGRGGADLNSCFVEFNGATATAHVYVSGAEKQVGTFNNVTGSTFELTYHRALNALSLKSGNLISYLPLSSYQSIFEVRSAIWTGSINNLSINICSGGSCFYGEGISKVTLHGGAMIGYAITGNLQMTITPTPLMKKVDFLTLSDRFLLFDP